MTRYSHLQSHHYATKKTWPPLDLKYVRFPDASVPQLFAEAVAAFPGKTALRGDEGQVTYTTLHNYARALAAALRERGVTRGSMVGLAMSRSHSAIGAILGIMLASAAYVPLDIEGSPESLLKRQILDSGVSLVLVDGTRDCKATAWGDCATFEVPPISTPFPHLSPEISEILTSEVSAEDPAYVMFTSGSTGVPKGVVVPHRAVVRLVSAQRYLNFSPNETFLLHSPLSFDASTLELWGSLLHGGCLAVAPASAIGVTDYREILEKNEVTTLWMTAAVFHLVADFAPESFRSLQQLIVGGDVVLPRCVSRVQRVSPHLSIVNGYGPTENCTFTACYRIPDDIDEDCSLPIGRPIEHTNVYILDDRQQPVSDGEAGELVAGGSGVAMGYVNRPAETAARFVQDPFSPIPGALMYRTGDRVRRDTSGLIHFLGRFDKEVKISGRRIDLTALEALLSGLNGVRACAAFALASSSGQKELAVAVEIPSPEPRSEHGVRHYLMEHLPSALLPTCLLVAPHLPVNANGKLDRAAIQRELEDRIRAPRSRPVASETERTLDTVLTLWRDLLGNDAIGPDDNFFDVNGSSLLLIRVHALLNQQYRDRLSLMDLFQATTARKISALLDARIAEDHLCPPKAG